MRNITRSNYTPHIGDYHNMIVHDPVLGKIWLFDCDGVFLDMSKTNVIVVNEAGQSDSYAISQQFVTNAIADLRAGIEGVDEASHTRDDELGERITGVNQSLTQSINQVNSNAIARENVIANNLSSNVSRIDGDIATLDTTTRQLTTEVNQINSSAVFDVTLSQTLNGIVLGVTDGTHLVNTTFREANANRNGLMPKEAYNQITENTQAIEHLQNAGLYRGSFATLADAPTTTPDSEFVGGEIFNNDFIAIESATHEGQTGSARYRAYVVDGNVTYTFETFIDKDIQNFSAGEPGLIVGGSADGSIGANSDGTGSVIGWGDLTSAVSTNTSNIATNAGAISTLQTDLGTTNSNVTALAGRVSTAEGNIATNTADIATNAGNISTNTNAITTLQNKGVQATTDTTIGANTENLLTVKGMMRQWVDITQSGLPASPDPDVFYYTVES